LVVAKKNFSRLGRIARHLLDISMLKERKRRFKRRSRRPERRRRRRSTRRRWRVKVLRMSALRESSPLRVVQCLSLLWAAS
jgi:hypothetical protein